MVFKLAIQNRFYLVGKQNQRLTLSFRAAKNNEKCCPGSCRKIEAKKTKQ